MATKRIDCTVNGQKHSLEVGVGESLLEVLRNRLHLTGTKKGCGVGECGACTVLVDGEAIDSCLFLAVWADGKAIRTIEGEAKEGQLTKVQKAFVEEGAVQCGFCTPGFVMSVTALTEKGCHCDREGLKKELSGHMCRCTGYHNIINAAEKAMREK
ncbi:2fe-2S iron-sulfur cluster binding domain [Heliomicrobium modesticaldum Ice1]|uniref:2fe-2S iron-sulfur cluster binding domain n=1 Tax=Heliobacterium modesticaldum (strain ATCC 51547 / Ice1) TaxID=498761 RepID=B0TBG2_HELMI|nr:xanthine dehydrogenase subunit XdhC [Heliomicrobium modesticaldum]ABZ85175.1 2fe-2S iron-sulfur cluster binding domain [Heliomicrobium modesticaldum Ice1]